MGAVKLVPVFLPSNSWSDSAFTMKYDSKSGVATVTAKAGGMFTRINPSVALATEAFDKNGNTLSYVDSKTGETVYVSSAISVRNAIVAGHIKASDAHWKTYDYDKGEYVAAICPYTFKTNDKGVVTGWDATKFNIAGTNGSDIITGGDGDDTLMGGKGRDSYVGSGGKDVFGIYGMKKNAKFITNFVSGVDTLLLRSDNKQFQKWQSDGSLFSVIARKRQLTGNQHMIGYNQRNGKMFFYNGNTGAIKLMAQFAPGTVVDASDIKLTIGDGGTN